MLKNFDDEFLLEAYYEAIKLNLEKDFVEILYQELVRRNLRFTPN